MVSGNNKGKMMEGKHQKISTEANRKAKIVAAQLGLTQKAAIEKAIDKLYQEIIHTLK